MHPFTVLRSLTISIALLLVTQTLNAQKTANVIRARSLKDIPENKDARIVADNYKSAYNFEIAANRVSVTNNDVLDLISLAGNVDCVRPVFYNDNIELSDTEIRYANGKNLKYENVCGHYEVDNIFYSDAVKGQIRRPEIPDESFSP